MKLLRINDVNAPQYEEINGKVDIPSSDDLDLANLVDSEGFPIIKLWIEPESKFFNSVLTQTINRSSGKKSIIRKDTSGTFSLTDLNSGEAAQVYRSDFDFDVGTLTEYTFLCVCQPNFTDAISNMNIIGQVGALDNNNYGLNLAFNVSGWLIAYKGTNVSQRIYHAGSYLNQTNLYAVTFSTQNGISLRVNGQQVAVNAADTNAVTNPNLPVRIFGNFTLSGGFQGKIGTSFLCNVDLLKDTDSLSKIESYLMTKYGI